MPFTIVRQDITKMKVDAIVNAANTQLQMGGGVCGAIFQAAGAKQLQEACNQLAPIRIGEAVITPGFALKAKYVIHAAGPVYRQDQAKSCEKELRMAYMNSMKLAVENHCQSIAFPLISSGIYGYPKEEALRVAVDAIQEFLLCHELDVFLVVFDKSSYVLSESLLGDIASYIDEHYVEMHTISRRQILNIEQEALSGKDHSRYNALKSDASLLGAKSDGIEDFIGQLDEPFSVALLRLIDAKGKTDVEVYKKANIDRKLFSKIRTGKGYMPSKRTVIALAIALELNLTETDGLLRKAGYALSHSQKFDVIIEYFIIHEKYDIFEINEVLFQYDLPLLGG